MEPGAPAVRATLESRAALAARIRGFFAARGSIEVDTPALSNYAPTDPNIQSLATEVPGHGRLWLHTSPEFPMKRLLAAGVGDCWQLCRVFRGGESGRLHRPDFLMLEWYRVGWDDLRLMDEVDALVRHAIGDRRPLGPSTRITYADAFCEHTGIAFEDATPDACREMLEDDDLELALGEWHDLVMGRLVVPALGRDGPCFITAYPRDQAALARIRPDGTAARFELVIDGVEIANGYHELTDAVEQRARFERDNAVRRACGREPMPIDEALIAALAAGLPECAGVALGFDRLLMVAAGATAIAEVEPFPPPGR